jgi:hypothetical protein
MFSGMAIAPADTVEPPRLCVFLNALAALYAEALCGEARGTWDEE